MTPECQGGNAGGHGRTVNGTDRGPSQSSTPDRASREWRAFRRGHGTTDGPQPPARRHFDRAWNGRDTSSKPAPSRRGEGKTKLRRGIIFVGRRAGPQSSSARVVSTNVGDESDLYQSYARNRERSKDLILTENFSPHSSPRPQQHHRMRVHTEDKGRDAKSAAAADDCRSRCNIVDLCVAAVAAYAIL